MWQESQTWARTFTFVCTFAGFLSNLINEKSHMIQGLCSWEFCFYVYRFYIKNLNWGFATFKSHDQLMIYGKGVGLNKLFFCSHTFRMCKHCWIILLFFCKCVCIHMYMCIYVLFFSMYIFFSTCSLCFLFKFYVIFLLLVLYIFDINISISQSVSQSNKQTLAPMNVCCLINK